MKAPTRSLLLLAALALLLLCATHAPTAHAIGKCRTKTDAPSSSVTPASSATDANEYDDDAVGAENEEDVLTPTPATSTPTPQRTKKPKRTKAPRATTAAPTDAPAATSKTPAGTTTKPAASTNGTTPSSGSKTSGSGKCVTGDPTQYITKSDVDWIWEKRMKPHYDFNNFIFDQLMTNNGKLSYCIRWDSTNKLPKTTAAKFHAMLERQYAQWNKWLVGYGCWPFAKIEVEMVGVAVRDKALLDWSDDSLGPIYEKVVDSDGIPMCPEACYKHRNFEKSSDTSACKGKPFDISLWPTLGQGGGAGGDWGQRVDEANMLSLLDSDSSVIVAHEIGHGFGLPDFYAESDKPQQNMPKLIMQAGASQDVTEGDGWLIRRGWEYVRNRYPSTSG